MRGWFRSVTKTLPGGRARSSRARRPRRSSPTSGSRSTVAVLYAIRRIHDLRRTLISLARSDGAKKEHPASRYPRPRRRHHGGLHDARLGGALPRGREAAGGAPKTAKVIA